MSDEALRELARKAADDLDAGAAELLLNAVRRASGPGDARAAARDVLRAAFKAPEKSGGAAGIVEAAREKLADDLDGSIYAMPDEVLALDEVEGLSKARLALVRAMCERVGHEPVPDQCGRPEHDMCRWCEASTPNGWKGRETK